MPFPGKARNLAVSSSCPIGLARVFLIQYCGEERKMTCRDMPAPFLFSLAFKTCNVLNGEIYLNEFDQKNIKDKIFDLHMIWKTGFLLGSG